MIFSSEPHSPSAQIGFTAPHHQAAEIGLEVLREGGSAIDAMIAAAAAITVLYPHMNSLAGDGFWLIHKPGETPRAIDACGTAAARASIDWYRELGYSAIPSRGALAAVTVGGTLSGWLKARDIAAETHPSLSLSRLLAPAIDLASSGICVSESLAAASRKVAVELADQAEYRRLFMPNNRPLVAGDKFVNPELADVMRRLAAEGLEDFYRGDLASLLDSAFTEAGSPLRLEDLQNYSAQEVTPLSVTTRFGQCYNLPAPTQGVASLLILAIYDRLFQPEWDEAARVHGLIEATKQAFMVRDREVADPRRLTQRWPDLLNDKHIEQLAARVTDQALPWPHIPQPGDTVWMGCVDKYGTMVSFIQSIYWEFGSGLVIPGTGLVWNNRGVSFSLNPSERNALQPGYKPFHTLNPAFAILNDGRRMSYGTMGGEGQPQTQAAIFTRHLYDQRPLGEAISRGRWLLGRTWGDSHHDLKMEQDLIADIGDDLAGRGHLIKPAPQHSELMGHAGALVHCPSGRVIAASDPRSDGDGLVEVSL